MLLKASQNSQENTCTRISFSVELQACKFIKKETRVHVFSSEICETFRNTFFTEHLRTTVSKAKVKKGSNLKYLFLGNFDH